MVTWDYIVRSDTDRNKLFFMDSPFLNLPTQFSDSITKGSILASQKSGEYIHGTESGCPVQRRA